MSEREILYFIYLFIFAYCLFFLRKRAETESDLRRKYEKKKDFRKDIQIIIINIKILMDIFKNEKESEKRKS